MGPLLILLVVVAFVWLLLIRPRQRQLRSQQKQIQALETGDEILTAGGIYGTVKRIDGDELHVEIAPDLEVRIARRAVAGVLTEHEPAALEPPEEPGEEPG
jgi:preprotein translocase subunit YajC